MYDCSTGSRNRKQAKLNEKNKTYKLKHISGKANIKEVQSE